MHVWRLHTSVQMATRRLQDDQDTVHFTLLERGSVSFYVFDVARLPEDVATEWSAIEDALFDMIKPCPRALERFLQRFYTTSGYETHGLLAHFDYGMTTPLSFGEFIEFAQRYRVRLVAYDPECPDWTPRCLQERTNTISTPNTV